MPELMMSTGGADQYMEEEEEDATRFNNSVLELKDLCSQLYHAADICQSAFLNATHKTTVVENTKEYVCRAVVTIVDHLGNVSAKLDYQLSKANSVSQTEVRIHSLQQKLETCQDYSQTVALAKVCWKPKIPRYHPRYISPPIVHQKPIQTLREPGSETCVKSTVNKNEFKIDEEVPLFLYTYNYKPPLIRDSTKKAGVEKRDPILPPVLPVSDGLSVMTKPQPSSFQLQEGSKSKRSLLIWRSVQNSDIVSLIRRRSK